MDVRQQNVELFRALEVQEVDSRTQNTTLSSSSSGGSSPSADLD